MPTRLKVALTAGVFGLCAASALVAQTTAPATGSPLVQTAHIIGDINVGFSKTCLIVYSGGSYHRERLQQVVSGGRPQLDWKSPEVFEGRFGPSETNAMRAILDAPTFSSVTGAIGDVRGLMSKLEFGPGGVILPHDNIEIVTVLVTRPAAPQIFEIAETRVAQRQEPLRALLEWIKNAERTPGVRLAASSANNCGSPATAPGNTPVAQMPTGISLPRAVYAPHPQSPTDKPKPRPVIVNLLINPDGSIAQASLEGRPRPDVGQTVLETVRKWRFEPARLLGVPIAMDLHLRIDF